MNRILVLSIADFRSTFREMMFKVLLFFPFIAFIIVRWVLPAVELKYPAVSDYKLVVLMWACLQSATMFGFIYGTLFLEEKEENLFEVIKITPVPLLKVVLSRLLIGLIISVVVNFFLIYYGEVVHLPIFKVLLLSFLFSLAAPLIALTLGAFAKNRIEGLAQMKIVNILLIIPALIYFIPHKAAHLTAIIPTYWTNRALEFANDNMKFIWFFAISLIFYLICFLLLNKKFSQFVSS
jgi:ABC-type multidrug transport system permease subunit